MPDRLRTVAVMTADIIGSSRYPPRQRQRIDQILRASFRETERRFRGAIHTRLAFRVTAGDEFQCVIADVPRAVDILIHLRAVAATGGLVPPLRFRASIGVGGISVTRRANPYEEDGVAFSRSRAGLEALDQKRGAMRWTSLVTGNAQTDRAVDVLLCVADLVIERWTVPQWEAVRWAVLRKTRQDVARKLRIAHQNVTKRLHAAGWQNLEPAFRFLTETLRAATGIPETVQSKQAPF